MFLAARLAAGAAAANRSDEPRTARARGSRARPWTRGSGGAGYFTSMSFALWMLSPPSTRAK